jgi:hypothetical protein
VTIKVYVWLPTGGKVGHSSIYKSELIQLRSIKWKFNDDIHHSDRHHFALHIDIHGDIHRSVAVFLFHTSKISSVCVE